MVEGGETMSFLLFVREGFGMIKCLLGRILEVFKVSF